MKQTGFSLVLVLALGSCVVPQRRMDVPKGTVPSLKGRQVLVVGVVGMGHFVERRYPLGVLGQFVSDFRPDLVVVQAPQAWVASSRMAALGPVFSYLAWEAGKRHIPVMGLAGNPRRELGRPAQSNEHRGQVLRSLLREVLPKAVLPPGFETAQSKDFQKALLAVWPDALYRGCPLRGRIVGWVLRGVREALLASPARKVLVFVGLPMQPLVTGYLGLLGAEVADPLAFWKSKGRSVAALAGQKVPEAVTRMWETALRALRQGTAGASGPAGRRRFLEAAFEVALKVQGGCCVSRKELREKMKALRTAVAGSAGRQPTRRTGGVGARPQGPGAGPKPNQGSAGPATGSGQEGSSGAAGPGQGSETSSVPRQAGPSGQTAPADGNGTGPDTAQPPQAGGKGSK